MPQKIKDIAALASPDIVVLIDGTEYAFPGDVPAELYVQLQARLDANAQREQDGESLLLSEIVADVYPLVLELFQIRQPDLERLPAGLSLRALNQFIGFLYGGDDEPDEAPGESPRPTRAAGTRSTNKRAPRTK